MIYALVNKNVTAHQYVLCHQAAPVEYFLNQSYQLVFNYTLLKLNISGGPFIRNVWRNGMALYSLSSIIQSVVEASLGIISLRWLMSIYSMLHSSISQRTIKMFDNQYQRHPS